MTKILWLAPAFNHYKARFLNHLALAPDVLLSVLTGSGRVGMGDGSEVERGIYNIIVSKVPKSRFGYSIKVRKTLRNVFDQYDWVLIPAERKNLLILLYACRLQFKAKSIGKQVKLVSYNHPVFKSKEGKTTRIDLFLSRYFYRKYDRVVFYTEDSCRWAISKGLIPEAKAFWTNNTIDETEIIKYKKDRQNPLSPPRLLMIGRLLEYRWIDRLIDYYSELKKIVPTIELHVIGDGPEKYKIEEAQKRISDIHYHGMLIDEMGIAPIFNEVDFVFIPGHSGLSINHSFAYGKPYITSQDYTNHPPEYSYLKDGVNSIILTGNQATDIEKIREYITDKEKYAFLRNGAIETATKLSIKNWVKQMQCALDL